MSALRYGNVYYISLLCYIECPLCAMVMCMYISFALYKIFCAMVMCIIYIYIYIYIYVYIYIDR